MAGHAGYHAWSRTEAGRGRGKDSARRVGSPGVADGRTKRKVVRRGVARPCEPWTGPAIPPRQYRRTPATDHRTGARVALTTEPIPLPCRDCGRPGPEQRPVAGQFSLNPGFWPAHPGFLSVLTPCSARLYAFCMLLLSRHRRTMADARGQGDDGSSTKSGAGGGTRTPTSLRIPDFESSASADSATPARNRGNNVVSGAGQCNAGPLSASRTRSLS